MSPTLVCASHIYGITAFCTEALRWLQIPSFFPSSVSWELLDHVSALCRSWESQEYCIIFYLEPTPYRIRCSDSLVKIGSRTKFPLLSPAFHPKLVGVFLLPHIFLLNQIKHSVGWNVEFIEERTFVMPSQIFLLHQLHQKNFPLPIPFRWKRSLPCNHPFLEQSS